MKKEDVMFAGDDELAKLKRDISNAQLLDLNQTVAQNMGKKLLDKQDQDKGIESDDVDNYRHKNDLILSGKQEKRGVKLSIYHEIKYENNENQKQQQILKNPPIIKNQENKLEDRNNKIDQKQNMKKEQKSQNKSIEDNYEEDEDEIDEKDDGTDDIEASKFKYSLTGSDIKLPPISEEEEAEKMRHIEQEKERIKAIEEALNPKKKTIHIQTDPPPKIEVKPVKEFIAPPTPKKKESSEESISEYEARSSHVEQKLFGKKGQEISKEQSLDYEYIAPSSNEGKRKKKKKAKIQSEDAEEQEIDLGIDDYKQIMQVDVHSMGLQADLESIDSLQSQNKKDKIINDKLGYLKQNTLKKDFGKMIQVNLDGQNLEQLLKDEKNDLQKQKELKEKKEMLLKKYEEQETILKQRQERELNRLQRKQEKFREEKSQLEEYHKKLNKQNKQQINQNNEINRQIDKMHEKFKIDEDYNMKELQKQQKQIEKEVEKEMKKIEEEKKKQEDEIDDEATSPYKIKLLKGLQSGEKPTYDMNMQTEENYEEIIGDHPIQMFQQNDANYSPKPFPTVETSQFLQQHDDIDQSIHSQNQNNYVKNQISKLPFIPGSYKKQNRIEFQDQLHKKQEAQVIQQLTSSKNTTAKQQYITQQRQVQIQEQMDRKIEKQIYSDTKKQEINQITDKRKKIEKIDLNHLSSIPNSNAITAGMNYDPVEKKFQYNTPKDLNYDEDQYIQNSGIKSQNKNSVQGNYGYKNQGYVPEQNYITEQKKIQKGLISEQIKETQPILRLNYDIHQDNGIKHKSKLQSPTKKYQFNPLHNDVIHDLNEYPTNIMQMNINSNNYLPQETLSISQENIRITNFESMHEESEYLNQSAVPKINKENLKKLDLMHKKNEEMNFKNKQQQFENEKMKMQIGTPKSKFTTITSNDKVSQNRQGNADNLPDNLNLGFGDSASQIKNEILTNGAIPTLNELKNRPFASNLENAKVLALISKQRIDSLIIQPDKRNISEYLNPNQDEGSVNEQMQIQEYEKQQKINKYLNGTLKHLNITVDILIQQYDPVKLKNLKSLTEKYGGTLASQQAQQEQQEANEIARKLDEIKNAEKSLKNSLKELQSLQKKYDKIKDWKYLAKLYKQCDEDKRQIEKLEKDNKRLYQDQKKAEFKLQKSVQRQAQTLFSSEINHQELIDLDNEYKQVKHKVDYLQEKYYKEIEQEKIQTKTLENLRYQLKHIQNEEQKIVEIGNRLYNIDFENPIINIQQKQQENLNEQKDKLFRKMVIIEDSKASIDKQYMQQHRQNQKKITYLNSLKSQIESQIQTQDQFYEEKLSQLRFYQEQKQARDSIQKKKDQTYQTTSQTTETQKYQGKIQTEQQLSQYDNIGQKELSIFGKLSASENQFRISQMNSMKKIDDDQVVIEDVQKSRVGQETQQTEDNTDKVTGNILTSLGNQSINVDATMNQTATGGLYAHRNSAINSKLQLQANLNDQQRQIDSTNRNITTPPLIVAQESKLTQQNLHEFNNSLIAQQEANRLFQEQISNRPLILGDKHSQISQQDKYGSTMQGNIPHMMKIEDIAIIRETLAELDDEELTALDLETHNFKQTFRENGGQSSNGQINLQNMFQDQEMIPHTQIISAGLSKHNSRLGLNQALNESVHSNQDFSAYQYDQNSDNLKKQSKSQMQLDSNKYNIN